MGDLFQAGRDEERERARAREERREKKKAKRAMDGAGVSISRVEQY